MRNLIKIGVVLLAAVFLGSCFLFGGVSIDPADVNRAMSIASHEAVYQGMSSVLENRTASAAPNAVMIGGTASGSADWDYTVNGPDTTGTITFSSFAVTTDEGDEYVIDGSATLTINGTFPTYTAVYDGSLSISVNGESPVDADVAVTYTFTVNASGPVSLTVTASGTVNGVATDESFDVTFTNT